jgi:hypothetical protein
MNLFKISAIVVMVCSAIAAISHFTSNPTASLYATLTFIWAGIALIKD